MFRRRRNDQNRTHAYIDYGYPDRASNRRRSGRGGAAFAFPYRDPRMIIEMQEGNNYGQVVTDFTDYPYGGNSAHNSMALGYVSNESFSGNPVLNIPGMSVARYRPGQRDEQPRAEDRVSRYDNMGLFGFLVDPVLNPYNRYYRHNRRITIDPDEYARFRQQRREERFQNRLLDIETHNAGAYLQREFVADSAMRAQARIFRTVGSVPGFGQMKTLGDIVDFNRQSATEIRGHRARLTRNGNVSFGGENTSLAEIGVFSARNPLLNSRLSGRLGQSGPSADFSFSPIEGLDMSKLLSNETLTHIAKQFSEEQIDYARGFHVSKVRFGDQTAEGIVFSAIEEKNPEYRRLSGWIQSKLGMASLVPRHNIKEVLGIVPGATIGIIPSQEVTHPYTGEKTRVFGEKVYLKEADGSLFRAGAAVGHGKVFSPKDGNKIDPAYGKSGVIFRNNFLDGFNKQERRAILASGSRYAMESASVGLTQRQIFEFSLRSFR